MSIAQALQDDIAALLDTHGTSVTFRRVSEGAYDPSTGSTAAGSTDDETAVVYFANYRGVELQQSNIERGDRKAYVKAAGLSKSPQTGDQFVGEAETVSVVDAQRIQSGTTLIAFLCQVRD